MRGPFGIINEFSRREIDTLFIAIQPAHLQKLENQELCPDDRDVVRAGILRDFMKKVADENNLD